MAQCRCNCTRITRSHQILDGGSDGSDFYWIGSYYSDSNTYILLDRENLGIVLSKPSVWHSSRETSRRQRNHLWQTKDALCVVMRRRRLVVQQRSELVVSRLQRPALGRDHCYKWGNALSRDNANCDHSLGCFQRRSVCDAVTHGSRPTAHG